MKKATKKTTNNIGNIALAIFPIALFIITMILTSNQQETRQQCEWQNRFSHPNHIKALCENLPKGEK